MTSVAAVGQYGISNLQTSAPASTSAATFVSIYGNNTYSGTGGFSGAGHTLGGLFLSTINAASQTVALSISCEGAFVHTNGTTTRGVGVLGSLNTVASGKTITTWEGVTSHANSTTTGTVGTAKCYNVDWSGFAGTVSGNLVNYWATTPAGTVTGLVYGFYSDDLTTGTGGNAAFASPMTSGANKFGLYMSGTAQNALVGATYIGAASTSGNGAKLEVTGVIEALTDRGLRFTNQTSGSGAQVGTITNAPTAGNPGHWLKVVVGSTSYAIPCWAG